MKQNFQLKEVLEFGNKIREYCMKKHLDDTIHQVFYNWKAYCTLHLAKPITSKKRYAAKLNHDKVKKIKILIMAGASVTDIAELYKVSQSCISCIKHNKTWKEVDIN